MRKTIASPLRIALLTPYIAPYAVAGGVGELFRTLAEGLGYAGHQVTVIGVDLHHEASSTHPWGEIVSLRSEKKIKFVPRSFQNALAVARELSRRRASFDVVECSSWPGLSAFLLNWKLPVVVRLITSVAVDSHVGLKELVSSFCLEWLAIRRAALVLVSTRYIKVKAEKLYKVDLAKSFKVPLASADIVLPEIESAYKQDKVRFLVIAAATKRKGTDVLLRALSIVAAKTDEFEMTLVGPDWAKHDQFAAQIPGLESTWHDIQAVMKSRLIVRYNISDYDKLCLLGQADYVIVTSRSESFGLPVVEALRSGASVISSRGGALSEVAGVSKTNLFYDDPEDFDELARVLLEVIAIGPKNLKERRLLARKAYEEFYTLERFIDGTVAAYREAIKQGHD